MRHFPGWWFQPLWEIWVRQLGWWNSQYDGKVTKKVMFQTTNQYKTLSVGTQHAQLAPATFCPVAIVMHCAPLKSWQVKRPRLQKLSDATSFLTRKLPWIVAVQENIIPGWWYTYHLEKWWSSSMGRIIPYMENKTCLKPPTRYLKLILITWCVLHWGNIVAFEDREELPGHFWSVLLGWSRMIPGIITGEILHPGHQVDLATEQLWIKLRHRASSKVMAHHGRMIFSAGKCWYTLKCCNWIWKNLQDTGDTGSCWPSSWLGFPQNSWFLKPTRWISICLNYYHASIVYCISMMIKSIYPVRAVWEISSKSKRNSFQFPWLPLWRKLSFHSHSPIGSMVLVYMLTLGVYWW